MKVLLIEDDHLAADGLTIMLRRKGHEVMAAASVDQAQDMLLAYNPDVVLSDLCMPGAPVEDLVPNLGGVPVVVLTALPVDHIPFPAAHFLQKPQKTEDIIRALEAAVALFPKRR